MARALLSPVKTAELFDVHPETLRRLARQRRVPSYKVGRYLRFDPDEVRVALHQPTPADVAGAGVGVAVEPDFDALDQVAY